MYRKSFLAGFMIGIGDIAIMACDNRYLSAFLFSVGLLAIIQLQLPLFTGRIGKVIEKKNYAECGVMLALNVLGTSAACGLYSLMGNYEKVAEVAGNKFSKSLPALFVAGILCNVLIHIAVTARREVITVLCVMGFILCGFEHSIADAGYAFLTLKPAYLLGWLLVVLGNAVGGIATELLVRDGN